MRSRLALFLGTLVTSAVLLTGCGQNETVTVTVTPNADGTATVRANGTPVALLRPNTATGRQQVPPPGTGSSQTSRTPNLGPTGPQAPATPPPRVTIGQPPRTNLQFDADTQAIVDKYRLDIRGRDATASNVAIVTKAAQLYRTRNHTLTVVIQRDPSKLPVAGVWYSRGPGATTELYQPQVQHVVNHEFAHDLTLKVDPASGNRFATTIIANKNDPSVFPTSYSRSNAAEAMAEALSFWAEKVARPGQLNTQYNPPAAVVADLQPFLSDKLKNK